ncbi:ubiquitin carboxyl-terminal hydrolase 30 homolog [Orussus abietinus]|uniref:ubiquitin carboxyl-terminal hydrolase 30 homolog n=1 Tax=Orussus abietinus TaxID=222816 RepID=UPI0006251C23|nr:ubiquitin carboxyl-terminal hydrolase 30 homolog [Orussus abietinus]
MDVEKIAVFAGVGFALVVGAFVLWGPSPRPRRKGQVAGITNLGFTCFLNALLQCLAACPTFLIWLQTQHNRNKNTCFTSTLLSVLEKVNGFSEDLYGDVSPLEIISALGPVWSFTPGEQDAHELFHMVLGVLQAEAQPSRKGCLSDALPVTEPLGQVIVTNIKGSGDAFALRSVSCNDIALAEKDPSSLTAAIDRNRNGFTTVSSLSASKDSIAAKQPGIILARSSEIISKKNGETEADGTFKLWSSLCIIPSPSTPVLSNHVHPFSGLLTSQLRCTNCNWKSSVRYDKFDSLMLPLPSSATNGLSLIWQPRHTLSELLSRLVSSEVIHDVKCDGCSSRCPVVKTLTLGKLPKCLCLYISRTTWSSSGMLFKRNDIVEFPETLVLDLYTFAEAQKRPLKVGAVASPYLSESSDLSRGKHMYQLQAVLEHRGPVDAGHFVSFRRGTRSGQWLFTSDSTVERVSLTDVICANPYLLFYEKINS